MDVAMVVYVMSESWKWNAKIICSIFAIYFYISTPDQCQPVNLLHICHVMLPDVTVSNIA